jgi:branched-chain amino acid transport system substrate-binding protein
VAGRNGAQLAVEEINTGEGCAGRKLELLVRDDRNSEETARRVTRELIEENVVAIIGHMTSGASVAALPIAEEHGTIMFSPTSSTPELSGRDDVFYRVHPATGAAAVALGSYAATELGLERVATVRDRANEAYVAPYHQGFVEAFASEGGRLVAELAFDGTDTADWDSVGTRLEAAAPEGVLVIASARDTARIAQLLAERGIDARLFSSGWGTTDRVLEYGGRFVDGMIAARSFGEAQAGARFDAFRTRFLERFGRNPSFAAVDAYDAVRILCAALERTDGRRQGLGEALAETEDFPGVYGPVTLDEYGDRASAAVIVEIEDGTFVERAQVSVSERMEP